MIFKSELKKSLEAKNLKSEVGKDFNRLSAIVGRSPSEMAAHHSSFFEELEWYEDEVHDYILDGIRSEIESIKKGDFNQVQEVLKQLEMPPSVSIRIKTGSGHKRQKLSRDTAPKVAKH